MTKHLLVPGLALIPRHLLRARVLRIVVVLLSLLPLSFCGRDKGTIPETDELPPSKTGHIYGTILGGLGPMDARVKAFDPGMLRTYLAGTDSSGNYHLDIPFGVYRFYVILPDGRTMGWMPDGPTELYEVIRLNADNRSVRIDPAFGSIRFRIPMTEPCDARPLWVSYELHEKYFFSVPVYGPQTPRDGFFDVVQDGLQPGSYLVVIESHCQASNLPCDSNGHLTGYFQVAGGRPVEWIREEFPLPARVIGRLVGPWAELQAELGEVEQPYVVGRRVGGTGWSCSGSSYVDVDGRFCWDMMFPDSVSIFVSRGRIGEHWYGGWRRADARIFLPRPGEVLDVGEWPGAALLARCTREDGQPLGAMTLDLCDAEGRVLMTAFNSDSIVHPPMGTIGAFHVEPGTYFLRAKMSYHQHDFPDWSAQWYPGVFSLEQAEPVEITSIDHLTEVEWTLEIDGIRRAPAANRQPDQPSPIRCGSYKCCASYKPRPR